MDKAEVLQHRVARFVCRGYDTTIQPVSPIEEPGVGHDLIAAEENRTTPTVFDTKQA